jgi:hypothetical protein
MIADKSVTIFTKSKYMLLDVTVEMQMSVMHGSKSTVHEMMLNGVLQVHKPIKCPAYGEGTLLTPANRSDTWYVLDL